MSEEPESPILQMLSQMRAEIDGARSTAAADLIQARKELAEQIGGQRRTIVQYRTSVIGHGTIIGELEARIRRIEQHLDLPPLGSH